MTGAVNDMHEVRLRVHGWCSSRGMKSAVVEGYVASSQLGKAPICGGLTTVE